MRNAVVCAALVAALSLTYFFMKYGGESSRSEGK